MQTNRPSVSVIIPAREAADTLTRTLESIASQTYPNIVEVIVAAADAATARAASSVTVIQNPDGTTPTGLNLAIAAASGEVIVRCDAHAVLPPDYVLRVIETMDRTGAENVGGMQVPVGKTFWERAIASAMASPLGAGDARYRIGGKEGGVETVYLGSFRRELLERLGGYDEQFLRSQDYELNHRILENGGVVWFDPALKVEYRPRGTIPGLAEQYFAYGQAKLQLAIRHRGSLRWRQLGPPVLVLALATSVVGAAWWPSLLMLPALYILAVTVASVSNRRSGWHVVAAPIAVLTMHLAWGAGFLAGLIKHRFNRIDR